MKRIKLYAISNPMWLPDTFVFGHIESNWANRPISEWLYVKVNSSNEIEEIGVDISKRMHNASIDDIIKHSSEPSKKQKMLFNGIGEEYWANVYYRQNRGI